MQRRWIALAGALVLVASCSSSKPSTAPTTSPSTTAAPATTTTVAAADATTEAAVQKAVDAAPAGCDPLDTTRCLLPFPSNAFTVADSTSTTGRRVALPKDSMPANTKGV